MASYKIAGTEARINEVKLDVMVYLTGADTDVDAPVGHFDVVLDAGQVAQATAMTAQARNAYLITLFEADSRITGIVAGEEAKGLLDGWFNWPIVITLQ